MHKLFDGALSEQFVCQELIAAELPTLFYWSRDDAKQEIDFVSENNSQLGIKISTLPYQENEKVMNLPLYNTGTLKKKLVLWQAKRTIATAEKNELDM